MGLKKSRARHGVGAPFYLGASGALAALVGIFVFMPLHVIGLVAVVAASVWDIVLLRKKPACAATTSPH